MKKFFKKINNLIRPAKLIVFVGVNGSGKTTLVNKLKEISPVFQNQLYLGWNNYFFKSVGKLDKHFNLSNKFFGSNLNRIRLCLLYCLLPFEFFARYLQAKTKARQAIILADRYPLPKQDFYKYKAHSFQKFYKKLSLRLTHLLLPKPSLLFILVGDPKTIWLRKKKSDFNSFLIEYKRCLQADKTLNCPTIFVNTDCALEDSFNQIYKELTKFINQ